ncbi:MAG: hypothetical protein KAT94_03760 [Candidatus Aenigmarchaeota archaeon]|nr:hypothetical protein [Candidatus Aenigmarchaeota archaeon]MCK4531959.1 hypothetical protein [Candidatus Aenigmarchaeota archaeon]
MRLQYNPKHLGDKKQVWRSFLAGSLIVSSLIYLVFTESVAVFFSALGLMIIGLILFIDINLSTRKMVFLSHNIFSLAVGGIISIMFHAIGFLFLYMGIVVILIVVTLLHKFRIRGKIKTSS